MAMQSCDVLIAIGSRFDERVIGNPAHFFQKSRTIIHIDVDPSSISKRVKVDVPIVGDVKGVLAEMNALLADNSKKLTLLPSRPGGNRSTNGAAKTVWNMTEAAASSSRSMWWKAMGSDKGEAFVTPMSASIKCGRTVLQI